MKTFLYFPFENMLKTRHSFRMERQFLERDNEKHRITFNFSGKDSATRLFTCEKTYFAEKKQTEVKKLMERQLCAGVTRDIFVKEHKL